MLYVAFCNAYLFDIYTLRVVPPAFSAKWSQDADYLLRQEERLQQSRKSNSIIQNTAGATEEPT